MLDDVDVEAVEAVLGESFGQQLFDDFSNKGSLRPGYLRGLAASGQLKRIYRSESNAACAVVTEGGPMGHGVPYLCKLAVTEQAMGQGTADALWAQLRADFPQLYWRSHTQSHDINTWFFERAEGMRRTPESEVTEDAPAWTVFWYGVDDEANEQLESALYEDARARPRSYLSADEYDAAAAAAAAGAGKQ